VDTSAFKAFYDQEDDYHREARAFMDAVASKQVLVRGFITSDYILDETITLVRFAHSHSKAVEFAKAATSSKATRVVYVGEENFAKALDLFSKTSDKEWSFTDCVSFTLMRNLNLTTAFTFDPHFREAGFHTLPK
jgi:predicted nucleic acid-binding protein